MTVSVEWHGLEQLQAKLKRLENIGETLGPTLIAGAAELRTWLVEYPPATSANQPPNPPPGTYYKRGTGSIYVHSGAKLHSRTIKQKDKWGHTIKILGKQTYYAKGSTTVRATSQHLNRSWSQKQTVNKRQAQVVISTRATYAPYLHDKTKQARFHGARGWRTVQAAFQMFGPKIVARIKAELDRVLGS